MIVYAVVDDALSPDVRLGDALEVFVRREDAERFIHDVRGDDPEAAASCELKSGSSRRVGLELGARSHPASSA